MTHQLEENDRQTLLRLRRIDPEMFAELAGNDTHLTHCAHCGGRLTYSWCCAHGDSTTGPFFCSEVCMRAALHGVRKAA